MEKKPYLSSFDDLAPEVNPLTDLAVDKASLFYKPFVMLEISICFQGFQLLNLFARIEQYFQMPAASM